MVAQFFANPAARDRAWLQIQRHFHGAEIRSGRDQSDAGLHQLSYLHRRQGSARGSAEIEQADIRGRFDGSLSGPDKDAAIADFRERWMVRAQELAKLLGLPYRIFGRATPSSVAAASSWR